MHDDLRASERGVVNYGYKTVNGKESCTTLILSALGESLEAEVTKP